MAHLTIKLQSKIIINVTVGTAYADCKIEYENKDGGRQMMDLAEFLDQLIIDTVHRMFAPHNILFPNFIWATYMPQDWRYARNVKKFRTEISRIIQERRSGKTQSYDQEDLVSILTTNDFFAGDDEMIIDEVITFFLAGMKTI